mmetsp:Transcript_23427/g.46683  ORF Transcript_23427/g.46683 Transcript_23427/m.46683 type:complete len:286 (-) Transcript_23427:314-1171(-)
MWNTAPDKTNFPMSIARPPPAPLSAAIHEPTPPQIHRRQTARNPGRLSPPVSDGHNRDPSHRPTPTGVLERSTAVTSQAAALARIAESRASGASPTPPPRSRPRIVSEDATSSALEYSDHEQYLAAIRAAESQERGHLASNYVRLAATTYPRDRALPSQAAGRLLPSQADELKRLIRESDATDDRFFTEGCRIQTHRRIVSEDMDACAAPKQRPTPRHRRSVSEHAIPPEDADRRVCCVCLDAPASHAFAPCGHYCLCGGRRCRAAVGRRCPVCRAAYDAIIKIY